MRAILIVLCAFTALAAAWLAAMEYILRADGYAARGAFDGALALPAVLTLVALARSGRWLKLAAVLAGVAVAGYGAREFVRNGYYAPHFEGYIALIALALVCQGVLTAWEFGGDLGFAHRRPGADH